MAENEGEGQKNLSDSERVLVQKISANPLDLMSGEFRGWLEDFIRVNLGTGTGGTGGTGGGVPGDMKMIAKDLTAETGVYLYQDESGDWLYCNGAQPSQTTYAGLFAFLGANAFGTDAGGNFFLPDGRGRGLFMCGTNPAADLGDNEGASLADRQAMHTHSASENVSGGVLSGAPAIGTLAVGDSSNITYAYDVTTLANVGLGGANTVVTGIVEQAIPGTDFTVTGAPSIGTLAVSAVDVDVTVGTGTTGNAPAHQFVGSLLIHI